MAEFLLELYSEEIPARMQKRAADDLNRLIIEGLKNNTLTFESSLNQVPPYSCPPIHLKLSLPKRKIVPSSIMPPFS